MADELTRKQLQEQLEAAHALIAEMKQPRNDAAHAATERRLSEALAELAALGKPQVSGAPTGALQMVPYKGSVQATEDCHIGGAYRKGPFEGDPGDVFTIEVVALWTDDPYVPVNVTGYTETGRPIVERSKVHRADFRFRPRGNGGDTEITALRAGNF